MPGSEVSNVWFEIRIRAYAHKRRWAREWIAGRLAAAARVLTASKAYLKRAFLDCAERHHQVES